MHGVGWVLVGVPAVLVLTLVVIGMWLLVAPRRIGTVLADGFGFQSRFQSHVFVKLLLLRLVGAALIGLAVFFAVHSLPLAQSVQRWQPAPQGPSSLTSCGDNRPHGMPCIPAH